MATYPHCDGLVLHAPGRCRFCDMSPELQAVRVSEGINFTGETDPAKRACPSTARRPLTTIERWPGNRAEVADPFPRDHAAQHALRDAIAAVMAPITRATIVPGTEPGFYAAAVFDHLEWSGYTIAPRGNRAPKPPPPDDRETA
jgi:hypothetical protein